MCRMVVEGYAAEEIRNRWREDIGLSRIQRKPSLLYEERPLFHIISAKETTLNKVCEYAGIARKAEEMLFFLSDFSGRFEINFYICNDAL